MIQLQDKTYVVNYNECYDNVEFINFSFRKNDYKKNNPALRIYFKNNIDFNIKIIKKIIELKNNGYSFCSKMGDKKIRYIISNYNNNEVLKAFEAMYIEDERSKIVFLYDTIFDELDEIWSNINPCGFCNNKCVGIDHNQSPGTIDGCCYSFDYPKNPFSMHFIENIKKCKHFNIEKRRCSIKNLSCKFFICPYVKRTTSFDINMSDFLLVESFFSKKQKLILQYNYFRTEDEIIDKLLAKNHIPYFIYYWGSYYRIKGK